MLWDFREALIAAKDLDFLFARLDKIINEADYLPMSAQIIDTTLVEVTFLKWFILDVSFPADILLLLRITPNEEASFFR